MEQGENHLSKEGTFIMKDFKKLRIMKIKTFRVQKYFLKIEMKFTEYKN